MEYTDPGTAWTEGLRWHHLYEMVRGCNFWVKVQSVASTVEHAIGLSSTGNLSVKDKQSAFPWHHGVFPEFATRNENESTNPRIQAVFPGQEWLRM